MAKKLDDPDTDYKVISIYLKNYYHTPVEPENMSM
jgi:hypothetical protein